MVRSQLVVPTGCWRCLMTKAEAKQVLQMLLGAFPRHGLDNGGVRMWADALSNWDSKTATTAAQRFIQRDEFMPSIAKFVTEAKRVINESKIGKPRDDCTNPDGCHGWWLKQEERPAINSNGEVAGVQTGLVAMPCSDCRPDLFARYKNGAFNKMVT